MHAPETKVVSLSKLQESPDNHRKNFGNLSELAESIRSQGILQPPVARDTGKGLELVFGHRRYRAAKMAGLKEMPIIVREMSAQEALEARLAENVQRDDVTAVELAEGYVNLMKYGLDADSVADKVGVSRASVYNMLKLNEATDDVKKALTVGRITLVHAITIARVKSPRVQLQALADVLKLSKDGEPPTKNAVLKLVSNRYLNEGHGTVKKKREAPAKDTSKAELRARVVARLRRRVGDIVERESQFDSTALRTMALALMEEGGSAREEVLAHRKVKKSALAKVPPNQLRAMLVELAIANWAVLDGDAYSPAAKVLASSYGVDLKEIEAAVEAEDTAEGIFKKV
jgi:ParB/RepB/Spo0J family partition protein